MEAQRVKPLGSGGGARIQSPAVHALSHCSAALLRQQHVSTCEPGTQQGSPSPCCHCADLLSNQHPTPLSAIKHAKHSPPQDLSPGCTPEELALPIPLLWPFYHHLSDLEAGHMCGWLQTHAAQKTGWGTSDSAAQCPPAPSGSRVPWLP